MSPRPRASADPFVEGSQLVFVVGVIETEHRRDVLDCRKTLGRTPGHALRRRIWRDEIGVLGFQSLEFVQQPIELLVGNIRRVVNVVPLFVIPDLVA